MRPDPHKQAASRKYQNKVRSRGGGTAGATDGAKAGSGNHRGGRGGARGGRGGRGGYHGGRDEQDEEEDTGDSAPRKSYARRKIVSNADRYIELDEEVNEAEELEQGIDRQTIAFREMLKDSDQRKTFDPAAYFRFKSEKEVEAQDPAEESQQARKLLEIRLDDIEKALMTLSIKERLYLQDSDVDALDRDVVGKVSLTTGKPIVPKLVRGQSASDILIKPSASVAAATSSNTAKTTPGLQSEAKQATFLDDHDLDDLLYTTTHSSSRLSKTPTSLSSPTATKTVAKAADAPSSGAKVRLPPPASKNAKGPAAPVVAVPKKGPPPPKSNPSSGKDEEWLDSVLGM
ncbi:hypothetical protein BGX34_007524 [Mortierella sp. NVP85]|nr:hypothetical protein BGX34_007524 [Mortierella sp. NVP85]